MGKLDNHKIYDIYIYIYLFIYRRKFRSQTSDSMDRWKAEMGRVREEKRRRKNIKKRKSQKKEDPGARKGWKVAKHCVFPKICGSGGSTSRLAKAAGAEPAGQMRDEKLHAVAARSTFRSQNVKSTRCSDRFWKLRFEKVHAVVAAKHISKSKCTKHTRSWPLLEVEMSKKCMALWREARFEVKMLKTPGVWTTFGGSDVVSRGRRKGLCTLSKVSKTWGFCSIFNYNHHYTTPHYTPIHYNYNYTFTTFHYTTLHSATLNYIQLHSITLNYTTLHYIPLHYTTLHDTKLHYTTLDYTTLHYIPLHYTTLHYTTLHYTTPHYNYTTFHYTTLQSTTLHCTPLHSITLHYTSLHYIPLHYTTFHYTTLH